MMRLQTAPLVFHVGGRSAWEFFLAAITLSLLVGCGSDQPPASQPNVAPTINGSTPTTPPPGETNTSTPLPADTSPVAKLESYGARIIPNDDGGVKMVLFINLATSDDMLAPLADLPEVENISLGGAKVTDEGLRRLTVLKNLHVLMLQGTKITDRGLESIKNFTQLERLGLNATQVTDAGLDQLRGLTHLKELTLGGTIVSDAGMAKLRQALPNCKIEH